MKLYFAMDVPSEDWQQGYVAGINECAPEIDRLRAENQELKKQLAVLAARARPTRITEFAPDIRGRLPGDN